MYLYIYFIFRTHIQHICCLVKLISKLDFTIILDYTDNYRKT